MTSSYLISSYLTYDTGGGIIRFFFTKEYFDNCLRFLHQNKLNVHIIIKSLLGQYNIVY